MTDTVGARASSDTESIDDVLRAIGHEYSRLVLYYLRDHDGMATEEELIRHLLAETSLDADIGTIKLQHDVLPQLDATGAIGVARTFAFGGAVGTPLWDPDGEAYSQIYHFEDKLRRLTDELHTDPAREIAEDRHAFLEEFRERFLAEWHGEA
jgi:hypothetical protein